MIDYWIVEDCESKISYYHDLSHCPNRNIKRAIWVRRPYKVVEMMVQNIRDKKTA